MDIAIARNISDGSWLHRGDPKFEEFKAGYAYACNQTMAIPALSSCDPEAMYYAWSAIQRGIALSRGEEV